MKKTGPITGTFIDSIINVSQSKIKQNKALEAAYNIIETVSGQASDAVSDEIRSYFDKINMDMEADIYKQKELLDRSLEDVERRISMESKDKIVKFKEIEVDLQNIREIIKTYN